MTIYRKKVTRKLARTTQFIIFVVVFVLAMTITFSDVYGSVL